MDLTDTSAETMINVVDQFDYSTQNDTYNEKFRAWRRNKENPCAFNFKLNRKESVFVEGKGFEKKSASATEQKIIGRIMYIAGMAMLMWIVTDNIFSKLIVAVFDALGFDIHTSFLSTVPYGGSGEIITALIVTDIVKILLPAAYIHRKMKMPRRVEFMTSLNHASDLIGTICMAMAVSAVTSLPNIYTNRTRQVFDYFRSINADVSVWSQEQFVLYTIFDIVLISAMSELFFRGAVFGALRQFGDVFAVIITSVMSALLVQDIHELPSALMISAVASVGMLRSGSIFTAIFVQVIFKMYRLALVILEYGSPDTMYLKRNTFILVFFIIGALGVVMLYIFNKKKNSHRMAAYSSEITLRERLVIAFRSFPIPAAVAICLLAAIIKFVL
jgi:hypothetical protein